MAVKEASVRLEVKGDGFKRGIRAAENTVKRGAKKMRGALTSELSKGAKGGLDALKGMFSRIKSGFTSIAGLAGGIGFGALIKDAVDADTTFRKLAFTVSAGSGAIVEHNSLMKQAQGIAERWGVSTEKLAGAMETVFDTTGDLDFATMTLDEIGKAARASGHGVETIAPIVSEMNRQFGVTAEEVPEALAAMLDLATRGGLSIGELGSGLGKMGRSAKLAGLSGVDGMKTMIGLVNQFTAASGSAEAASSNVDAVLRRLVSDVAVMDKMKKEFKIDVVGEGLSGIDALKRLLQATQGDAAELGKIFTEKGGIISAAFQGVDDFDAAIAKAATTTLDAAGVAKQANKQRQSAEAQISIGVEKLKTAFTKPEIIGALTQLAQSLPAFAEAVAKVMSFIANNPLTSAGMGMAATFGRGALGASMGAGPIAAAMGRGGGQAADKMEKGITKGGGLAAHAMAASFMAAGVAAAWEQASALKKELGAESWGDVPGKLRQAVHDKGRSDSARDAELVRIGGQQGVQAQREYRPGEKVAGDQHGMMYGKQVFLSDERNEEGKIETVARAVRTAEGSGIEAAVDAIIAAQSRQMVGLPPMAPKARGTETGFTKGPDVAEMAAANAQALAGQLRSTQLQTRLDNVNELATAIGNQIPTPTKKGSDEVP